jgi:hypothetical protein
MHIDGRSVFTRAAPILRSKVRCPLWPFLRYNRNCFSKAVGEADLAGYYRALTIAEPCEVVCLFASLFAQLKELLAPNYSN